MMRMRALQSGNEKKLNLCEDIYMSMQRASEALEKAFIPGSREAVSSPNGIRAIKNEYVANLRRSYSGREVERYAFADKLENCDPASPCNTAACPLCSAAYQR